MKLLHAQIVASIFLLVIGGESSTSIAADSDSQLMTVISNTYRSNQDRISLIGSSYSLSNYISALAALGESMYLRNDQTGLRLLFDKAYKRQSSDFKDRKYASENFLEIAKIQANLFENHNQWKQAAGVYSEAMRSLTAAFGPMDWRTLKARSALWFEYRESGDLVAADRTVPNCPICGTNSQVHPIIYGTPPTFSSKEVAIEHSKKMQRLYGTCVHGGCIESYDSPQWDCDEHGATPFSRHEARLGTNSP